MQIPPALVFNAGYGNVFYCKTFTSTIRRVPEIEESPPPPPTSRVLSYLDRLVTCANTGDLSNPPRREWERNDITLNAAKFLMKIITVDTNPNNLVVYIVPSNVKKDWGSMIEISRGKYSFTEHFQEHCPLFAGTEDLYAELRCAEHGSRWYAEIHRRKES